MTITQIDSIIAECRRLWTFAQTKWPAMVPHRLPTINFDLRGTCAGQAHTTWANGIPTPKLLRFNPTLGAANFEDFLADTVTHEVAHLVAAIAYKKRGHGTLWRHVCRELGMREVTRCHQYDTSILPNRKTAYCGCEGKTVSTRLFNAMRRGSRYRCKACGQSISWEKKIDSPSVPR